MDRQFFTWFRINLWAWMTQGAVKVAPFYKRIIRTFVFQSFIEDHITCTGIWRTGLKPESKWQTNGCSWTQYHPFPTRNKPNILPSLCKRLGLAQTTRKIVQSTCFNGMFNFIALCQFALKHDSQMEGFKIPEPGYKLEHCSLHS